MTTKLMRARLELIMTAKLMRALLELMMNSRDWQLVANHQFTSSNVTAKPVRSCMVPDVMMVSP